MLTRLRLAPMLAVVLLALAATRPINASAEEPKVIKIWPETAPGERGNIGEEHVLPDREGQKKVMRITNVTSPTISIYAPPSENRSKTAVVICPGGGYSILAWDLEGTEVAEWLNSLGVTAVVLKYRVPVREKTHLAPLQDVQRAMRVVRQMSIELGIDKDHIGVLGFSAGGNLAARACLHDEQNAYEKIDATDDVSCKPNFGVLVYPAYLHDEKGLLKPEYTPTAKAPPMFFAHAFNDPVKPESSIALFQALRAQGVVGELHLYSTGGHGFGLRASDDPCSKWPARCGEWMTREKLIAR